MAELISTQRLYQRGCEMAEGGRGDRGKVREKEKGGVRRQLVLGHCRPSLSVPPIKSNKLTVEKI